MPKRRQPQSAPRWVQGCFDFYRELEPLPAPAHPTPKTPEPAETQPTAQQLRLFENENQASEVENSSILCTAR